MKVLALILGISFAADAWALQCTPKPSCESLGFTDTDCSGEFVACPFDQNKKICVSSTTCEECKEYDCSAYSLTSCPESATSCTACGNGLKVGYKVDGCKSGYELSGNTCVASNCSGYTLSYCPTGANCLTCVTGSTTKYKFNGCQSSYAQDGNSCYDCAAMRTKLDGTAAANKNASYTVYAYCGYHIGSASCGQVWFDVTSWPAPFCSVAGISCLSKVTDTYNDCCATERCNSVHSQYTAAVEKHNQLCPNNKVSREYFFNCNGYIPASSTGTAGIPAAHVCPRVLGDTCVGGSGGSSGLIPAL